ncbi:MAG: AMP-dependent synthetase/ligase [Spirochaetota bacterium]
MRTVIRMLHEAADRYPNRHYTTKKIDSGWVGWTFKDTDRESDQIAAALLSLGFSHQSKASIVAEGRPEWITAEFGVVKAACISVPLSIKLSFEEIAFRVNHSGAQGFFVSSNTIGKLVSAWQYVDKPPLIFYLDEDDDNFVTACKDLNLERGKGIFTWSDLGQLGSDRLQKEPALVSDIEPTIDENDVINICYTSGTTGNPKGIMLSHLNYWANAQDGVDLFKLEDASFSTLVILPLDHSFAHTVGTYASLLRGITLNFVDARGGSKNIIRNIPGNLTETNPTFLMTVPSLTGNFMKKITAGVAKKGKLINAIFTAGVQAGIRINGDGWNKPSPWVRFINFWPHKLASLLVFPKVRSIFGDQLRYCVGGGALLEVRQQNFFAAIGVPIYQGYGLTEAAPIICSNTPKKHKFGTSGIIAPSVECKIMKSETQQASQGERGEIVIRGKNVMQGYYKNEKASKEVLRDGWLWTGDLGYFDEDGFLVVTGRAKALLIASDGEKFSPEEVEEAVINHAEFVNQVLVYNDHKTFTGALVTIHAEKVKQQMESQMEADEVLKMIQEDFYRFKRNEPGLIPQQWVPEVFEIIPKEFSEEDGLINSTMKMVRYKVTEMYQERIDAMYADKDLFNDRNREAVSRTILS